MHLKFFYRIIDNKGNSYFSNHKMEDIDVSAKSEKQFAGYWFVKDDITNKCIRTDGSLCIVWGVEYFGNIYDQ